MKTKGARKAAARGHPAPGREAVAAGDEPAWREHYRALVVFHRERGHCDVPSGARPHRALAAWLTTQREREAKGRLDPARKAALEELGVEFTRDEMPERPEGRDRRDGRWDQRFAELAAFHARFGPHAGGQVFSGCPRAGTLAASSTGAASCGEAGAAAPEAAGGAGF